MVPDGPAHAVLSVGTIDHVGIAVADLDEACARYTSRLGASIGHREKIAGQSVEVAFVTVPGETTVELVCPTAPDSPLSGFLERRGEGLHHLCFRVADIEAALKTARAAGLRLIDEVPRPGAAGSLIGFLHPSAFGGVLVELKQKKVG